MRSILTNKLCIDINYQNIERDFDIYKITTIEKFIPGGAFVLDKPLTRAKSIVFEYGRSFYMLYGKNMIMASDLKRGLQQEEKGDTLSFERIQAKKMPDHLLVQLYLNSINNPNHELLSFNNLTGKLIIYRNDWINTDKNNFIWSLECLDIRVGKDMCLSLIARRLSAYALKNKMKFIKRKIRDYPQYVFTDHNQTMRRANREELNHNENFIMKPIDGERAGITFLNFQDQDKFECTKIGVLYKLLSIFKEEYRDYIKIDFEKYTVDKCLQYKKTELEQFKEVVNDLVKSNGIVLLDGIKDETSELYLKKLREYIVDIIPEVEVSIGMRVSKQKLNIKLIHNKDYYEGKSYDPHNDSHETSAVQHITIENFKLSAEAAIKNVLKELVIKKDLISRKISLIDWQSYGYDKDWMFGIKNDGKYFFMNVHPDGAFKINRMERNLFNMSDYDKYMDYFGENGEIKYDFNSVVGLIRDDKGNVNLIRDTNQITVPEVVTLGEKFTNLAKDIKFPGTYILNVIERLIESTVIPGKHVSSLCEAKQYFSADTEYGKTEIINIIKNRTVRKLLTEIVFSDTGELLYLYLRNQKKRNALFGGLLDINYIQVDFHNALYNVGTVGAGMQTQMERASVVRKVEAVDEGNLIFDEVLPLMGVEFVRYGMLTVMPFPFKYLREYALLEEINNKSRVKKEVDSKL